MLKVFFRIIFLFSVLLLSACNDEQITDGGLTHKQANVIIATLGEKGIFATAEKSGRRASDGYFITVKSNNYLDAIKILNANDLPKEEDPYLKYLTKDDGFFSIKSKDIEGLKKDKILADQLEQLILNISNVKDVKVAVKNSNVKSDEVGVAITIMSSKTITNLSDELKKIVQTIIPNIPLERIRIITSLVNSEEEDNSSEQENNLKLRNSPAEKFFYWNVAVGDSRSLLIVLFIIIFSCSMICLLVGYYIAIGRSVVTKKNEGKRTRGTI